MGKSWFCLNLACSIAFGCQFLGVTPSPQRVLYLSLEDTPRRIKERLAAILPPGFEPEDDALKFAYSVPRLGQGCLRALEATLHADPDIKVVIIDTWAMIKCPARTGSSHYDKDYNEISQLKKLAEKFGIALVLVHHMRKTGAPDPFDMVLGSNGSTGASDNIILLTKDNRGTGAILKIHSRDMEDQDIALRFDQNTRWWQLLGKPAEEFQMSQERQQILDFMREEGQEAIKLDYIAKCLGKKVSTTYNLLKKLVHQGLVEKIALGKYRIKTREQAPEVKTSEVPNRVEDMQENPNGGMAQIG